LEKCVLNILFFSPSVSGIQTALKVLWILPWIMEIGGIVRVIIGLAQLEAPSVDKEHEKNDKVKWKHLE